MNTKSAIYTTQNEIYVQVSNVISVRKIKTLAARIIERIRLMDVVMEERRQLSKMSPKMLADIGIDAETAKKEYVRRYFDLPNGRW